MGHGPFEICPQSIHERWIHRESEDVSGHRLDDIGSKYRANGDWLPIGENRHGWGRSRCLVTGCVGKHDERINCPVHQYDRQPSNPPETGD